MATRAGRERSPDTASVTRPATYDLWFDESGTFRETSTRPVERAQAATQRFPSQLAGLLVPRGALSRGSAEVVLDEAHKSAGIPLGDQVHGTDIAPVVFDLLIGKLITEIRARLWQPVRLVNRERVTYGDRIATYTRMVAELVLRVLRELSKRGEPRVNLYVHGASVTTVEHENGSYDTIHQSEYIDRIQEALTFVAVRRGHAPELSGWHVAEFELLSGRRRRELQVCDLISNASHASFKKVGPNVRKAFKEAFGPFDQSLVIRELFERVDDLIRDLSFGRALMLLAESGVDPAQLASEEAGQRLCIIVGRLAALGARTRDPELDAIMIWLEQIIEYHRSLEDGCALVTWLLRKVEGPLRKRLETAGGANSLDWFTYALHHWRLRASTHMGDLAGGRRAVERLDELAPGLAERWEHTPLLMQGLIAQAVHRTDCFAYDDASARTRVVAGYYGELSGLFSAAMPGVFPARIRSNARGEALGTWLQSEMYAALRAPERLDRARMLSDEALAEFTTDDDKARQRQYRCQLETIAGNLVTAREFLADSMGLATTTHEAIGKAIAGFVDSYAQGFALLHWLRLGRAACMVASKERDDFLAALKASQTLDLAWCTGGHADYPAHGILRQVAVISASNGAVKPAFERLSHLRSAQKSMVLSTIVLAAIVEVAGVLVTKNRVDAERLLDNKKDKLHPGALQLLEKLGNEAREGVPELWAVFEPWEAAIRGVLATGATSRDPKDVLLRLGRAVPY